ncbi:unnamed protein product [Colias eurytheme]|nr:unnamed protein product [Colias eurytheme]
MTSPTSPTSEPSSSEADEFLNTTSVGVPEKKRKKKKKDLQNNLPTLSKTCDRYEISDRPAAAIASSVLHDIGSDVEVIDRHKLRKERSKNREVAMLPEMFYLLWFIFSNMRIPRDLSTSVPESWGIGRSDDVTERKC